MSLAGRTIPGSELVQACVIPYYMATRTRAAVGNGPLAEAEAVVGGNGNEPPGGMGMGHLQGSSGAWEWATSRGWGSRGEWATSRSCCC
ncbi:hypothetical protein MRB53_012753 [Persea americana]|uniref:Uncharacterized protein n=1 Tax=Persea americana TaxID=3435 RepID=A0ACC2LY84_PERAE|nr:hypothetical protein MRB53_012753 [Persea americana]